MQPNFASFRDDKIWLHIKESCVVVRPLSQRKLEAT